MRSPDARVPRRRVGRRLTAAVLAGTFAVVSTAAAAEPARHVTDPWTYLVAQHGTQRAALRHEPQAIPAKSYGPSFPTLSLDPIVGPDGGMTPEVKQAVGCVLTGTVATLASLAAGGENLINVVAGGLVAPANTATLYIGLIGVVFASFCAIGQAMTPIYLYYFDAVQGTAPASALQSDCPTCRQARTSRRPLRSAGPLVPELQRVADAAVQRSRAAASATAGTAIPGMVASRAAPSAAPQ